MSFIIRELKEEDLSNGFIETLSNLSEVGKLANDTIRKREILREIKDKNCRIVIAEDNQNHQIIGSATLLIEQKFIHNGGKAGHIEDVVTRKGYEGKGIGREILKELIKIAKDNECYKIILDCDEKLVKFYEKLGFKKHSIMMRLNT
ncbi:MAG TPA: GNAT family N-acetyltransferase [Bacillales bacterium]|nr:GNAT family N-acetyltransferase [Candidatus Nitrosocosmicus sp.]HZH39043.1 GNAT family N-acetyltransferase [Bacillales bacterium]